MSGYYVGLDVHKKTVSYCVKMADGTVADQGVVPATRRDLKRWVSGLGQPWIGGMEATLLTGWICDFLSPHAADLHVGHPLRLKAITAAKKKSDRLDARTLADLLRSKLFPDCYMAPPEIRELRQILRYRNLLVQEATRMKNKAAGLLMEVGAEYHKSKLHGAKYFANLLDHLEETPASVVALLKMTRVHLEVFQGAQRQLLEALASHPELKERVERLMTIPGVGQMMALTWALEIGEPHRIPSVADGITRDDTPRDALRLPHRPRTGHAARRHAGRLPVLAYRAHRHPRARPHPIHPRRMPLEQNQCRRSPRPKTHGPPV